MAPICEGVIKGYNGAATPLSACSHLMTCCLADACCAHCCFTAAGFVGLPSVCPDLDLLLLLSSLIACHDLLNVPPEVIAYGQTGSGKTYTMLGNTKSRGTNASLPLSLSLSLSLSVLLDPSSPAGRGSSGRGQMRPGGGARGRAATRPSGTIPPSMTAGGSACGAA